MFASGIDADDGASARTDLDSGEETEPDTDAGAETTAIALLALSAQQQHQGRAVHKSQWHGSALVHTAEPGGAAPNAKKRRTGDAGLRAGQVRGTLPRPLARHHQAVPRPGDTYAFRPHSAVRHSPPTPPPGVLPQRHVGAAFHPHFVSQEQQEQQVLLHQSGQPQQQSVLWSVPQPGLTAQPVQDAHGWQRHQQPPWQPGASGLSAGKTDGGPTCRRATTHVMIAYHIFFQQLQAELKQLATTSPLDSQQRIMSFSCDPTHRARLLRTGQAGSQAGAPPTGKLPSVPQQAVFAGSLQHELTQLRHQGVLDQVIANARDGQGNLLAYPQGAEPPLGSAQHVPSVGSDVSSSSSGQTPVKGVSAAAAAVVARVSPIPDVASVLRLPASLLTQQPTDTVPTSR